MKHIKILLMFIITFIAWNTWMYLLFSMIDMNFNPLTWCSDEWMSFRLAGVMIGFILGVYASIRLAEVI